MPRYPTLSALNDSLPSRVYSDLNERAHARNDIVYPLHVGDTYRQPISQAQAQSQLTEEHAQLHNYAAVRGETELLQAIVAYVNDRHGVTLPIDALQVMAGATSGLNIVCQALLEPGDEVLLPSPFWPLIRGAIATKGAIPVEVPFYTQLADPDFDPESVLENAITEKTVAIYINTPHNPTGASLSDDVITAMLNVANRHHLWMICDEAYEEIYFEKTPPQAIWTRPQIHGRSIATHTLSKSFGLAGARVGFTHGPPEVMKTISAIQTFQTYCAAKPMQFGAMMALMHGQTWLAQSREHYAQAAKMVSDALGLNMPQGGTFVFFDAAKYLKDEEQTCAPFLERCADEGVLLTPGSACGKDYVRWVRLCFTSVDLQQLMAALKRLQPLI